MLSLPSVFDVRDGACELHTPVGTVDGMSPKGLFGTATPKFLVPLGELQHILWSRSLTFNPSVHDGVTGLFKLSERDGVNALSSLFAQKSKLVGMPSEYGPPLPSRLHSNSVYTHFRMRNWSCCIANEQGSERLTSTRLLAARVLSWQPRSADAPLPQDATRFHFVSENDGGGLQIHDTVEDGGALRHVGPQDVAPHVHATLVVSIRGHATVVVHDVYLQRTPVASLQMVDPIVAYRVDSARVCEEDYDVAVPPEFCCPINHCPMAHPVRCEEHWFDYAALEQWFKLRHTSPLTRRIVDPRAVLATVGSHPALQLKAAIDAWRAAHARTCNQAT